MQKGSNIVLPEPKLTLSIAMVGPDPLPDVSAYLLDANGKVRGDHDMVFYGQPLTGDGSVGLTQSRQGSGFQLDLARVHPEVTRIAFAAAFGPEASRSSSFATVRGLAVEVTSGGRTIDTFAPDTAGMSERALVLVEVYRRDAGWKLRAVAQGFVEGLGPLSRHFGVDIDDAPVPRPGVVQASVPRVPPTPTPEPVRVSLAKVSLDKSRKSVDLTKRATGFGQMRVNLNWNTGGRVPGLSGLLGRSGPKGVDLDLGCLFELLDGSKGTVQALGDTFGSYTQTPFIELSGDDRSGTSSDGEWMRINGAHWHEIKRVLVYAFIYEGVPNWSATDGVVTLHVPDAPPVEVKLDEAGGNLGMCAVALLENVAGSMRVSREVSYHRGHRDMDHAFSWGLNWKRGSKG